VRHKMVWLAVGGAVGTLLRYGVARWFNSQPWGQAFPYGTLFINVTGSFILAFTALIIVERLPPEYADLYLLLGTGFCGGYTTFSTFEWETFRLVRNGSYLLAAGNALGSVLAGYLGVVAAALVEIIFPKR
jgi:fluoride exporter